MIHYHVWFDLKPGFPEQSGLEAVAQYLAQLCETGEAAGFELLCNSNKPPKSKLPRFHALIEFADSAAFGAAMKRQAQRGIHTGAHGRVVEAVSEFHVEVFTALASFTHIHADNACVI